jgi:hypothetical protein
MVVCPQLIRVVIDRNQLTGAIRPALLFRAGLADSER